MKGRVYTKLLYNAANFSGPLLGRVPRVPGTRKILSSYVVAPVIFYEIPGEQLPGTRKISTPLISGTRGLMFLTGALRMVTQTQFETCATAFTLLIS